MASRLAAASERLALTCPLVPPAIAAVIGILLDRYLPAPIWVYLLTFLLAGAVLFVPRRPASPAVSHCHIFTLSPCHLLSAPAAILAIFLAGAATAALRHQVTFWRIPPDHLLTMLDAGPNLASIRGTILTEPILTDPRPDPYSIPARTSQRTSFILQAEQYQASTTWRTCDGLIRVGIAGPARDLRTGDRVQCLLRLNTVRAPGNPGQFDWQLYQRRSGIYVTGFADQQEAIEVLQPASMTSGPGALLSHFRQKCRHVLLEDIDPEAPESGLLAAYVAGHRWSVARQIDEAFRRSGTAHILAVSGSHVMMIGAFGLIAGKLIFRRPRRAAMAALSAVLFFSIFVEPSPPALRATVMAVVAGAGLLLNRSLNPLNTLAASLLVLLLLRPSDLFDAGFQLSFIAVIALALLCRPSDRYWFGPRTLAAVLRTRINQDKPRPFWKTAWRYTHEAISTSLTAWIASAPLMACYFGHFYPYGPISTLILMPAATVALAIGFCKLVLGLVLPSTSAAAAPPAAFLATCMSRLAAWCSSWPGACIPVQPPALWLIALFYTVLLLWAWAGWRQRWAIEALLSDPASSPDHVAEQMAPQPRIDLKARRRIARQVQPVSPWLVVITVAGLASAYWWQTRPARPPAHTRMHVLAVGDGLAIVVRSPNGKVLLYDCGSSTVHSLAETIILPALQDLGIQQVDTVVLSHPDLDHYSGLAGLAQAMPIGEVCVTNTFLAGRTGLVKQLLEDLRQLHVPVRPVAAGQTLTNLAPLNVQVIWPPADFHRSTKSDNDTSIVLSLESAGQRILLAGDIDKYAQRQLTATSPGSIRADLLVLPHHGRTTTLDMGFVLAAGPQVLVASTGDAGQLSRGNLLASLNWNMLDTDTCGMITADFRPEGLATAQFRHTE